MKKILSILLITIFVFASVVRAQNEATLSSQDKEIQLLKDKLASKVAELEKKEKKAISGFVRENKNNKIALIGLDETSYEVRLDDLLTKVYDIASGQKKEIKTNALVKNDYIIISGPISDRVITANNIYKDEQFVLGSGDITEVNKTDNFLKIMNSEKETITLDIETDTKRFLTDVKNFTTETVGIAKIKEGDVVHYVYKPSTAGREKNRFSATKILIIPQEYFHK